MSSLAPAGLAGAAWLLALPTGSRRWVASASPAWSWPSAVVAGASAAAAAAPRFVRVRDYPGIGSALAWDRPVVLQPGDALARSFTVAIADGRLSDIEVAALADQLLAPATAG